jgi:outer membrane protein TolC
VNSTRITNGRSGIAPELSPNGAATRVLGPWSWRRLLCGGVLVCGVAASLPAQSAAPRVALVLDQQTAGSEPQVAAFQREIQGFFHPGEITLLPPVAGDGTGAGVTRVLQAAMRDSSAAVVVALGPIGSHLLAHAPERRKPAIAATIIDATWQGTPRKDGASGVRNLAYVDETYALSGTIADFRRIIPFRRMAILLDPELLRAVPGLDSNARALVRSAGADAEVVPARGTADQILAALPGGIDAVYLTVYPALSQAEMARLITGLAARRLPTLSHMAADVAAGALASYEPPEHWLRRARRVAVDLQRILAGEDAGTLPVALMNAPRLTLNLATARAIGFSPGFSLLTEAELVGTDSLGVADTISLADAMRGAAAANLDLRAADLVVESGAQNVRLARSGLLPRLETRVSGTFTREETAAASFGQQPERRAEGGFALSVPLYSEQVWAGYGSERRLQEGRDAQRDQVRLDVVQDAAAGYLNVWRARTLAEVRRTNLYRSRSNLEVARVREGVGSTNRADIYRWEGEVATARRDLIATQAEVQVASLQLRRLLNRPLGTALAQQPVPLDDPALLARDSAVLRWLQDPAGLQALTGLLVGEAVRLSPELSRAEAAIAATRRQHTAAQRAFWLPTFSLEGAFNDVLGRGGAGSSTPSIPGPVTFASVPDLSWQVRLQASLPLFTGGGRGATRERTKLDIERLEAERDAARLAVEQRIRGALEQAASSYAAIALTRDAAEAAGRNYELVSDAYGHGAASITALIDAQSAALSASEAAANAVHDFLLELVRVERAMGTYGVLQSPEQRQAFLERLATLEESR